MHRSGTSLVASVLQKAGLDIGHDISGPGLGNPHGHFEDQDFFQLHEDMLAAAGESCFSAGDDFAPPMAVDFARRARALAAAREALPLWGWKDPRTCLFLGFWAPILPQARYLFLYRHPVDVVLSLWRRNNDIELREDPWMALRAWEVYNRRLLEFRDRHAESTFLAQVPALAGDFGGFVRCLGAKLGLPLHDGRAASIFVPEELMPSPPPNSTWEELIPEALALYRRLEESADLPARGAAPPTLQSARERELLSTSEVLLYALLERRGRGGPTPLELRQAYFRVRLHEEAVRAREEAIQVQQAEAVRAHEEAVRAAEEAIRALEAATANDRARIRNLEAALRHEQVRAAEAEARGARVSRVLAEIEGSLSFAPVRTWWRLRRRLGGRRAPAPRRG